MIILPVLDVRQGRVVHAAGGDRRRYPALSRRFPFPDDPVELAGRLRERWGERPLYLADLDALAGDPPDLALVETLAGDGHRLRVDAAVRRPDRARALLRAGARQVVVGLETLEGWEDLERVAEAAGRDRTVFSLDVAREFRSCHNGTRVAECADVTDVIGVSMGQQDIIRTRNIGRGAVGFGIVEEGIDEERRIAELYHPG
jgi:uncharacterized protein related to proFAR isomerase